LIVENSTAFAGATTEIACPQDVKTARFFSVVFPDTATSDAATGNLVDFWTNKVVVSVVVLFGAELLVTGMTVTPAMLFAGNSVALELFG
jgi:hypothetical protein